MDIVAIYTDGLFRSTIDTFQADDLDSARRKAAKRAARSESSVKLVQEANEPPAVVPGPSMYRQTRRKTTRGGK